MTTESHAMVHMGQCTAREEGVGKPTQKMGFQAIHSYYHKTTLPLTVQVAIGPAYLHVELESTPTLYALAAINTCTYRTPPCAH